MNRLENLSNQLGDQKSEIIYAVPIGTKRKGETHIYRKPSQASGLFQIPSEFTSLVDFWDNSVRKHGNNRYIEDLTFSKVDQLMKRVGSWIRSRGHQLFFYYCTNSINWTIADIASWNYGLINVPLYDTLGKEAFDHILKICEGTLLFTTRNLMNNLYNFLSKNKYQVRQVCFFDSPSKEEIERFQKLGLVVSNFTEALSHNTIIPRPKLSLDHEITYGFTSGTTGIPKGVVYTHRMVISQCLGVQGHFQTFPDDVVMSYLPIAHTFQRFMMWLGACYGSNVRYAKYPVAQILKDLAEIRPTMIVIVPRLLNKLYPVVKGLVEKQGNYNKARALFGGRLRRMATGSAPISPTILSFFAEVLGADIREGYGQTQTTAASFITYEGDRNYGHVGGPNASTEYKLVDVPEMNYFSTDSYPRGEICLRGDPIFKRYFKDPVNTAETVDSEGWNHSGDIGMILPNGSLKIIDRKKNIYKLQQAEYVAPEKVQNIYCRCKYVAEAFLYGDSMREYNVGIIHPSLEQLPTVAKTLGIAEADVQKLCQDPRVVNFILQEINKQGRADGLAGFELAKKIVLWPQPFQVVGILTSTMKLQRYLAREKFKKQIERLYQQ